MGADCAIECSTNFNGWVELMNLLNTNGTLDVIDESATNFRQRYYRTRQ